jgi:hypothetical protein
MFVLSHSVSVIIVTLLEGEKQERGGHGFELSCVMVGAGAKASSPLGRDSDGNREEQEVYTVFVKASQDRSIACKGWRSVSLSATLRQPLCLLPVCLSALRTEETSERCVSLCDQVVGRPQAYGSYREE